MFIDREPELAQLAESYASDRAELFVLYGRRRVGKTELLREHCRDKRQVFFVATLDSDEAQLAAFSQQIWGYDHENTPERFTFPSWQAAFDALAELPDRPVVVLDEFTYLVSGNGAVPSILQKSWDATLRDADLQLVLCGSYIGMMEREVLTHQAPLYGRRTGSLFLRPLELPAAAQFFPEYAIVEQIEAWAVLGGQPYYLETFDRQTSLLENIERHVLARTGTLYDEPQLLMAEELREPRNYFSVLRAIAHGRTRLNEITQGARLSSPNATARYLDILRQMHIVAREVPVTESRPAKSKKGIYRIDDGFLRFWFRFVHPYRGALELGLAEAVLEQHVRPQLSVFMGHAFENAAREHVARLARAGELPFLPERIGRWWDRSHEIDVIALSEADGALLAAECKWSSRAVGTNVLDGLAENVAVLTARGDWPHVTLALYSRSGFTADLERRAAREGVRLYGPQDLVRA